MYYVQLFFVALNLPSTFLNIISNTFISINIHVVIQVIDNLMSLPLEKRLKPIYPSSYAM